MIALLVALAGAVPAPKPSPGLVEWTFDDGPHSRTGRILDLLRCHHVRGTFYVLGGQLDRPGHLALLRRTVREGHRIGNHLFTHREPCRLSRRVFLWELRHTGHLLEVATGIHGIDGRRYRPPNGSRCHWRAVRRAGYRVHLWHVADIPRTTAARYWARAMRRLRRGKRTVLLFHYDVRLLAGVLDLAAKAGYVGGCNARRAK